jgi:chloride channel protein, CIC family
MTAVVLAAAVSSKLSPDTIYTLKLRRRGIDIKSSRSAHGLELLTVADAMQPASAPLPPATPLAEVIAGFTAEDCEALPVVDAGGAYRGVVVAREAQEAIRGNALEVTAGQLARALPELHPGQSLHSALTALLPHESSGLPVLTADGTHLAGWLHHRDVLRTYTTRLHGAATRPGPVRRPIRGTPAFPAAAGQHIDRDAHPASPAQAD